MTYSPDKAAWRVFQIVFVISAIRSIAGKEDLDVVDVLHVATGGGKSEAYFALLVFSMFFERIKGKGHGITAIVKFPLRMLSIQQLERLASVMIYAELVRKENVDTFKGSEFTLGYYVGNSDDFPDLYSKLRRKLYEEPKMIILKKNRPRSKVLTQCPFEHMLPLPPSNDLALLCCDSAAHLSTVETTTVGLYLNTSLSE